jgi:hypothetical protein
MKKAQKSFKFLKISIPFILVFSLLPFFNLHYLLFQVFVSKPITILLVLTWFLAFLLYFKKEVFGLKLKKENGEKVFFYAIFITFIVFYLAFFSGNLQIIVAQTSTCAGLEERCNSTFPCCSGYSCINFGNGNSYCEIPCSSNSDCPCKQGARLKCLSCDYVSPCGYCTQELNYATCDTSCGADSECNGRPWGADTYDTNGDGYNELFCNDFCKATICNSQTECSKTEVPVLNPYTCFYSLDSGGGGHYGWADSRAAESCSNNYLECFDGHDNDCNGKKDGEEPGCAGCCRSDSDCPTDPNTHLKMYCDINTHTCQKMGKCTTNDQCDNGWCCYSQDYGGSGTCKQRGETISYGGKSYICDPP